MKLENEERYLNVPNKFIVDNEIVKLIKNYIDTFNKIDSIEVLNIFKIIENLDDCINIHKELVIKLNNKFIRVYGKCTDMFNKYNSYVEYIGKINYNENKIRGQFYDNHPTDWEFKGISIHRNADTDDILWIDTYKNADFYLFNEIQINYNTLSIITFEEYSKTIDLHFKKF